MMFSDRNTRSNRVSNALIGGSLIGIGGILAAFNMTDKPNLSDGPTIEQIGKSQVTQILSDSERFATRDVRLAQVKDLKNNTFLFPALHFVETLSDFREENNNLKLIGWSIGEQASGYMQSGVAVNFVVAFEPREF